MFAKGATFTPKMDRQMLISLKMEFHQVTEEQRRAPTNPYDQIQAIWDAGAAAYDSCPGHSLRDREQWAWRRVLERVMSPLNEGVPLRILDVGTGTGTMSTLLANMGCEVTGVDIAAAMIEQARRKSESLGVPLKLIQAKADSLPFDDEVFDMVFSRHLFWTLPRPVDALREWVRVVKGGGIVAVADGWWNEPSESMRRRRALGRLIRKVAPSNGHEHPGYDRVLTKQLPVAGGVSPYSIRYFLDQAGLDRLKVRDLASIRAAERRSIPPWFWIDRARHTWLATGHKPE
jgi:ubiquinone/menaquinone biosynthesis C-methylase UbiE